MALGTPTLSVAVGTSTSAQHTTTGSFTPTANAVLVVHVHGVNATAPGVPTISGGGLTYTQVSSTSGTFNSTNRCATLTAPVGASPSAMTVDADWGAAITNGAIAVFEITGADTTTPVLTGTNAGGTGTSTTPASSAVPAITAGNVQIFTVASRAASVAPESGAWTELYDAGPTSCRVAGYYNTAGDTTPTATTTSSPWRVGAAEIAVAPASGGVGPDLVRSVGVRTRRPSASLW